MDYQTLKSLFRDHDKMVRLFCLRTALRDNLPQIEEFLREGLRDEHPEIVVAALRGVRRVSDPEIVKKALVYLESPDPTLRGEALTALEGKSSPAVRNALGEFLRREEDPTLLATAIKVVSSFASPEYIPILKAFLNYGDDRVRANAVEALSNIDHPEVLEIMKSLVSDKSNRVCANAIQALWKRGIKYGINLLPEELRSPNARKRASVAYVLGFIKDERSFDLLVGLLGDISPTVRKRAVLSLGQIGNVRAIPPLLEEWAKEEDSKIRDTIIVTCFGINPELTILRLAERYAEEKDEHLRATLIRSLGLVKNHRTIPLLTKALRDADGRVRANAVQALSEQQNSNLTELLYPMLNDSNNRVRSNTAAALWKLGGLGAIVTLKQMLRSSNKQMRTSAAWALGEIGAIQFSDLLQHLTDDPDPDVCKWALKALAKVAKIA